MERRKLGTKGLRSIHGLRVEIIKLLAAMCSLGRLRFIPVHGNRETFTCPRMTGKGDKVVLSYAPIFT